MYLVAASLQQKSVLIIRKKKKKNYFRVHVSAPAYGVNGASTVFTKIKHEGTSAGLGSSNATHPAVARHFPAHRAVVLLL